ncbi:hypothetical protein, partial [Pseudomonas aeruginosa]
APGRSLGWRIQEDVRRRFGV